MTYRRGSIYLANFNPSKGSEPGKVRPCLVLQNDALNDVNHQTIAVVPLTTQLLTNGYPMRFQVNARDKLSHDSQIMMDQIRSIDQARFSSAELTKLSDEEIIQVEDCLRVILGFE